MKKVALAGMLLMSSVAHAENFGDIFARCMVTSQGNPGYTYNDAWKHCESFAEAERNKELAPTAKPTPHEADNYEYVLQENRRKIAAAEQRRKAAEPVPYAETIDSMPSTAFSKKGAKESFVDRNYAELKIAFAFAVLLTSALAARFVWSKFSLKLTSPDTRAKRIALLVFPFFAVIDSYLLARDLDHYGWEPSLSFALFFMASVLCLVLAFSGLSDWIAVRDRS